jgi:4-hydroxy-4-methyl-2-oxoglutarate aldolase
MGMPETTNQLGVRQHARAPGVDRATVEALGRVPSTDLSDVMRQSHTMDPGIKPLSAGMSAFSGNAVTISLPAGSQAARAIAMLTAGPGDVVVINSGGLSSFAVLGGRVASQLHAQGVVGVIVDGCVRDQAEIAALDFPVLCRGVAVSASPAAGPGEGNVPISCGGVVVAPGDVIVADVDGAVVVPREWAESVLESFVGG